MPEIELDPVEQRVLGSLAEKQQTVPASYPLSLNALRTACNQTTSRDPVTDYDDKTIIAAIDRLKQRGLARTVWAGGGSRVLRYHQILDEVLELSPAERALLTVLLLRGEQSAGELRTRTERLHPFADKVAVEAELKAMAQREVPLVKVLPRQPGQQDPRWCHLLGPSATLIAEPAEVDRESVLSDGAALRNARVVAGYDALANTDDEPGGDLGDKPLDGWLLDQLAGFAGPGQVADVGCGQGQVSGHLAAAGAAVTGFDLSPQMVQRAANDYPALRFEVADFSRLLRPRNAPGWTAIAAWYAFSHLAASELPGVVAALVQTLIPGGWLAIAVETSPADPLLETTAGALPCIGHDPVQIRAAAVAAGLVDLEWYLRSAYPGEPGGERFLLLGRRPA